MTERTAFAIVTVALMCTIGGLGGLVGYLTSEMRRRGRRAADEEPR